MKEVPKSKFQVPGAADVIAAPGTFRTFETWNLELGTFPHE
jgi:hypothetical protein